MAIAMIIVGGQNSKAEAYDHYVGTYNNGLKAYLVTETILSFDTGDTFGYTCTVKAVNSSGSVSYINYEIMLEPAPVIEIH